MAILGVTCGAVTAILGAQLAARRPLTSRGLQNLEAFARLYGYVRFFHPTDAVRTADWNDFALRGVQLVEACPTADSLARTLRGLFAPVAPTVRVLTSAVSSHPSPPPAAQSDSGAAVSFWRHVGIDPGDEVRGHNPYSSALITQRLVHGAAPTGVPEPLMPLGAKLGGGVWAVVPLARNVPPSTRDEELPYAPIVARSALADDRSIHLAVVVAAWAVLDQFYAYFDATGTDWAAELRRALRSAAVDADSSAFLSTLRRMMAALHDGHAYAFHRSSSGELRPQAPAVLLDWVEDRVVVTYAGDSANAAGLRAGDVILSVDGKPAESVVVAAESLESGATPAYVRVRALRYLLMGPANSVVRLRVRSAGHVARAIALRRDTRPPRPADRAPSRLAPLAQVAPGIVYVDLDRMNDSLFEDALPRLVRARGVIFDFRGYPPFNSEEIIEHLIDTPSQTPHFEIPILMRPRDRATPVIDGMRTVAPASPRISGVIACLTGPASISAVETTLGMFEDYHLGVTVGEATAGTNGNFNSVSLPGGYGIQFTGMRVRERDGSLLQGRGIRPDVPAHRTLLGVGRGEDEVLERAVEVVQDTIAVRPRRQ